MSNFGFQHLRVVNDYKLSFREARSAVGAPDLLNHSQEFATVAEAIADCSQVIGTTAVRHRDLQQPLHSPRSAAPLIRKCLKKGKVALLFGSEKTGLSQQDLSHCHSLIRIPTRQEHISMNLGQAVAVALYELIRGSKPVPTKDKIQPATADDLERMTSLLTQILATSEYTTRSTTRPSELKLRRLIHRLKLSAPDANALLGMLRQIDWKLRSNQDS